MNTLLSVIKMFRVNQWVKNAFVLMPLFFSLKLFDPEIAFAGFIATLNFCFLSSLIYILNDWNDRQSDSAHETKKFRPFASGEFGKNCMLAGLFFCLGGLILLFLTFPISINFYIALAAYGLNSVVYTYFLKNVELVEMFVVALGYIVRVVAGVLAIGEVASPWILFCSGSVALSIIAFKRRAEIANSPEGNYHRVVLEHYSTEFLNIIISISLSFTLVSYALFTISDYAINRYQSELLPFSSFFVLFGILRFVQINIVKKPSEDPTSSILQDKSLMLSLLAWTFFVFTVMYR